MTHFENMSTQDIEAMLKQRKEADKKAELANLALYMEQDLQGRFRLEVSNYSVAIFNHYGADVAPKCYGLFVTISQWEDFMFIHRAMNTPTDEQMEAMARNL